MNKHQLHILQHALGLDDYGRDGKCALCPAKTYRNHYITDDNDDSGAMCNEMVASGLMERHAPRAISGEKPIFTVTEAGRAYIREHSPKPPRLSAGQARYQEWLDVSDAFPGLSFGDWLRRCASASGRAGARGAERW